MRGGSFATTTLVRGRRIFVPVLEELADEWKLVVCGKQNSDYPWLTATRCFVGAPEDVISTAGGRLTTGRRMPSCPTSLEETDQNKGLRRAS